MEKAAEDYIIFDKADWDISPRSTATVYARKTQNENSVLHKHNYIEFFYVTKGTGTHYLNRQKNTVQKGDACLLTLSDNHGFSHQNGSFFVHTDILINTECFKEACNFFSPTFFKDISEKKYTLSFNLSSEQIAKLDKYVPYLFLNPETENYKLTSKAIIAFILDLIIDNNFQSRDDNLPLWLIGLIGKLNSPDNFTKSIPELTEEYVYNADYMRRVFKKYFNVTMTEYFNLQKMNYAFYLLNTSDLSVENICEIIGINNLSHFYHLFKKMFNQSPKNVRP